MAVGLVSRDSCSESRCSLPAAAVGVSERNFSKVFSSLTLDVSSRRRQWAFTKGFVQTGSNSKVKFRQ